MTTMNMFRNERLYEISQMLIGGQVTYKLDNIATIYINSRFYFNVFRRYNSPYNIVIEDYNGDIYLHQDHTVRTSLKAILCLNDVDTGSIYTYSAHSYKHNGPVPTMPCDIADMRWTEIQQHYQAAVVGFGVVFNDVTSMEEEMAAQPPSTPVNQKAPLLSTPPPIQRMTNSDKEAANILVTLCIPQNLGFHQSESDKPEMSMKHSDVKERQENFNVCYCHYDDDNNESEYDDESDTDSDMDLNNYIVLRNGTVIRKAT